MTLSAEHDWLVSANGGNVRDFFAELGIMLPDRNGVEAAVSCFANPAGHRRDDRSPSCSVNLITGLWHCKGCGERGNPYRAAQLSGRSDRNAASLAQRFSLFLQLEKDEKPSLPGERKLKQWRRALRESPIMLDRLRVVKGWEPRAVVRLGLGWDGERITFPVRTAKLKVAGVVRYLPGGDPKTLAWPGTKRNLFPPPELIHRRHPLFLVEGEPDAVAVWSTGYKVVAVPGAGSWRSEWGLRFAGRTVVVLTDCDPQGRQLAARVIADAAGKVRVVDLEPDRDDGYDIGDVVRDASREGGLEQVSRWLGGLL